MPVLYDIITSQFNHAPRAHELFDEFFEHHSYSRPFAATLIGVARAGRVEPWEVRRLAALMLEHQVRKLPVENEEEFDFLLTELGLKSAGDRTKVKASVLKEGYSTTSFCCFVREFRRRLERHARVHDRIMGRRSSKGALLDFIKLSAQDCKLYLARYLFQPEEVANEILKRVKTSKGIRDLNPLEGTLAEEEAARTLSRLPDFEAKILKRLITSSQIYWVSDSTSSEINSLVEYPVTTVALVIKPPGSDLEIEIKRAGRRGAHAIDVVFWRDNVQVPPSHRLDGASMQWLLRWEADSASKLSRIYRLVHGAEAPVSSYISRSSIYNVPVGDTEVSILDYFTEAGIFGRGFDEMRAAMAESVAAFKAENNSELLDTPGDLGLTVQFLGQVTPNQTILTGTTSFRLDRLAEYLSSDGLEIYFTQGLKVDYSKLDAKRLADTLLEEVLSEYRPPETRYRNYSDYLDAAFGAAENRERADQNYLAVIKQIGAFWGTLLAVRGYTWGESFVTRNVGLRSVWEGGQWRVKIIFMDHDNLHIRDIASQGFRALEAFAGTTMDELHILGNRQINMSVTTEMDCLRVIYRVGEEVIAEGKLAFYDEMRAAYRKTQEEVTSNPRFGRLFHPAFVARLRDWDEIVKEYLSMKDREGGLETWKEETRKLLGQKGYGSELIEEHLAAVEKYADLFERYSFLY